MSDITFGLDTFGDVPTDDHGAQVGHARSIRQLVDEAVLADQLGVDVFAVGEHHRPEYSVSSPETVLAGLATATERIRLSSGVTVLSLTIRSVCSSASRRWTRCRTDGPR